MFAGTSHQKLIVKLEEAVQIQLNNAQRRIAIVQEVNSSLFSCKVSFVLPSIMDIIGSNRLVTGLPNELFGLLSIEFFWNVVCVYVIHSKQKYYCLLRLIIAG